MPFIDGTPWITVEPWTVGMPFIDGQIVDTASTMGINVWVEQE